PVGNPRVVGVDMNANSLRDSEYGVNGRFCPVQAKVDALPFRDGCIDGILSSHVLEHLLVDKDRGVNEGQEALNEAGRVLRKDGKAYIAVPHPRHEMVIGKLVEGYHSSRMHQRVFSPNEIEQCVENAGFDIERISSRGWWGAIGFVGLALINRMFSNGKFVDHQGLIVDDVGSNIIRKAYRAVGEVVEDKLKFMNRIFPQETFIEARKQG
ncbi:methyltransferase domain-containing protein, partial [Patescibacteria group bacterium]